MRPAHFRDTLTNAVTTLRENKLRSRLAILRIVTGVMTALLSTSFVASGQQKQTIRAYFEALNSKAAAGQPLPPIDQELYSGTNTVPLAEIKDAAPAIREALTREETTRHAAGMLMDISLRLDTGAVLVESREAMEQVIARGSAASKFLCLPLNRLVTVEHIDPGAKVLEAYLERPDAVGPNGAGACFAYVLLSLKPIPPDADAAVARFIRRKDLGPQDLGAMTNTVANTRANSPEVVKATVELIHDPSVNSYLVQEIVRQPQVVRDGVQQELMHTLDDPSATPESRAEAKTFLDQMNSAEQKGAKPR